MKLLIEIEAEKLGDILVALAEVKRKIEVEAVMQKGTNRGGYDITEMDPYSLDFGCHGATVKLAIGKRPKIKHIHY